MKKMLFMISLVNFALHSSESLCSQSLDEEQKSKIEKQEYLTDCPKTEDFLKRVLTHKTLCPQVLNDQGLPEDVIDNILKCIQKREIYDLKTEDNALFETSKTAICMLPNNNIAHGKPFNHSIRIYDSVSGKCIKKLKHNENMLTLCSLDNENLASGFLSGLIKIWDTKTGKVLHTLKGHSGFNAGLYLLPNNNLASCGSEGLIKIWDTTTGECLQTLENKEVIKVLCYLPDDRLATYSYLSSYIKIWNIKTGEIEKKINTKDTWISSLCALPDGNLVTCSNDCTKVWDTETGLNIKKIRINNESRFIKIRILPDGNLALATHSGNIYIFNLDSDQVVETINTGDNIISFDVLQNGSLVVYSHEHKRISSKVFDITNSKKNPTILKKIKNLLQKNRFKTTATALLLGILFTYHG